MASGFKKRVVSADRVAAVETAAASAPIIGDPRIAVPPRHAAKQDETPLHDEAHQYVSSNQVRHAHAGGYEVGMVYEVPVGLVNSNPFPPRAIYTTTAIETMAASLANNGQRISATGYLGDNGEVVLIEGETRLRGARLSALPTLRIEIKSRPNSDRELYEEARSANVERNDQTPLDDAVRWKELIAKKVYPSQAAIAKALGIGEDYVSRTCNLSVLPSRIIQVVAEIPELLSLKMLNAIREYWEVKGDESTLELIFEAAKTGMGYRDVVTRRKAAAKGPIKRPRSTREKLSFRGAQGELKTFEEDGRVELSLKGLTIESAQDLTEKIMTLFPKETA